MIRLRDASMIYRDGERRYCQCGSCDGGFYEAKPELVAPTHINGVPHFCYSIKRTPLEKLSDGFVKNEKCPINTVVAWLNADDLEVLYTDPRKIYGGE